MGLRFVSFTSGSSGNCSLVISDDTAILIDAGISFSRLREELNRLGLSILDISGVLVTHEHSDHIACIDKLSKYVSIYSMPKTLDAIVKRNKKLDKVCYNENYLSGFSVGDLYVKPFEISHDAVNPVGYTIAKGEQKISVATDMGHLTDTVLNSIQDSQTILLESNHDLQMLKEGPYPIWLKSRIFGKNGHLSNTDAASAACKIKKVNPGLQNLILGHISKENNTEDLVFNTAMSYLDENCLLGDTNLSLATQGKTTSIFEIL